MKKYNIPIDPSDLLTPPETTGPKGWLRERKSFEPSRAVRHSETPRCDQDCKVKVAKLTKSGPTWVMGMRHSERCLSERTVAVSQVLADSGATEAVCANAKMDYPGNSPTKWIKPFDDDSGK